MAMAYATLLDRVRQWANRDEEALPNIVIQEGLRWSADTAYRELQTPPLEYTQQYVLLNSDDSPEEGLDPSVLRQVNVGTRGGIVGLVSTKLPIPEDLTTFIQIRVIGTLGRDPDAAEGVTKFARDEELALAIDEGSIRSSIVFNEKTDIRTFYDGRAIKVSSFYWSRQQNNIVLAGRLAPGDVIEVLYYRRLPALDARYLIESTDFDPVTFAILPVSADFVNPDPFTVETRDDLIRGGTQPSLTEDSFFQPDDEIELFYLGAETDHWLRDQNERILIFGALWQSFDYLGDDAMGQKYAQKYQLEMQEINKEELRRKASGGNTQVHYSSNLI